MGEAGQAPNRQEVGGSGTSAQSTRTWGKRDKRPIDKNLGKQAKRPINKEVPNQQEVRTGAATACAPRARLG
ncbi:MAG: hypothetical protein RBU37_19225 [Myxococcota bacterium]|nr:hypothetical protein [Myxococcota bacterium]